MKNWASNSKGVLEDWFTACDQYVAPEYGLYLCGSLNGKNIRTSRIIDVDGIFVKTRNSVYELGSVKPEFLDYLKSINKEFDKNNPIKIIKR